MSDPETVIVEKCPHCRGVGRVAGIECGLCESTGFVNRGTVCPCPGCREGQDA